MTGTSAEHTDNGIMRFWALAQQLKHIRRQGWLDRGVNDAESSADHSWGVALLAWLLACDRPDLNRDRVLLLGLVHDLPEAVAGDAEDGGDGKAEKIMRASLMDTLRKQFDEEDKGITKPEEAGQTSPLDRPKKRSARKETDNIIISSDSDLTDLEDG